MSGRWTDYYLTRDLLGFWRDILKSDMSTVCVITGLGFDPRCTNVIELLAGIARPGQLSYLGLLLQNESSDLSNDKSRLTQLADRNRKKLGVLANATPIGFKDLPIRDSSGYPCGGRVIVEIAKDLLETLGTFEHVIIDISGLPRSTFFPLVKYLVNRSDKNKLKNVHVVATENRALDGVIQPEEFGEADYLQTFRPGPNAKFVWVPVVGKGEEERVRRIYEHFKSDCEEICPVIPFPGPDLRLADEVVTTTGVVLLDECGVSPSNLMLCDAANPYDAYRKISELQSYYKSNLAPMIGSVTTVVSPLASKSLSLGILLAAIEHTLPVCYVETGAYRAKDISLLESMPPATGSWSTWLTGTVHLNLEGEA